MRSETPKVLHPLCGRPMILHVLDRLVELPLARIVVVVGHGAERVSKTVQEQLATEIPLEFVEQNKRLGTGDAAGVGLTGSGFDLDTEDDVLVLTGDTPLLRSDTLAALATEHRLTDAAATILTAELDDPTGYGRIVRNADGVVDRIVEQTDANDAELAITEVNSSIYCFRRGLLAPALRRLEPENGKGEYYLTDVVGVLRAAGHLVVATPAPDPTETLGVNDRAQLAGRRGRPARPHQPRLDAPGRDDDRPGAHLRRRGRRARARGAPPARHPPRGPHRRRGRLRHRAAHPPRRHHRRRRRHHRGDGGEGGRDRRRRDDRPLRVAAPRHPDRGRRARRHLRRDQERRDRRRARRSPTSRTSATPRSGRAPTSAPGRSPRTTTAARSTARGSGGTRGSARTTCSSPPSRSATTPTPARARS